MRSGRLPRLAQRLPANQRAPEREKGFVDVRALVVPYAQAPELAEPRKRPLHNPPPSAQATPMLGAAHGQQGHNVTSPETVPNGGRVVAAIPDHTVRPLPRSPAVAVQRGNRVHQRQGFLRVVPVRAGQANRKRDAPPVTDQMTLAPSLDLNPDETESVISRHFRGAHHNL